MGTPVAPAVDTVERLLLRARTLGASDLHLDPDDDGLAVSARRDGVLVPLDRVPPELASRIVGRLKSLADLLAYRSDVPQEGRIAAARSPTGGEIRVATYPTLLGERVALRFDTSESGARDLDALGLPTAALDGLRRALVQPDGVILLTGPAGSGKTTSLYAAVRRVASGTPPRSVVTVEDPVERRVPGVVQTQVSEAAGLDFPRALRSLLRQDPEVLLVGEIRDAETARVALEAGLTGHLVLSTVHAGTAARVFARLVDLGVEPFVVTTAVRGVLAQRLVRRRCPDCAGGCDRCAQTGYRGRRLVAEWLPMSPAIRAAVLARQDGDALATAAAADGFRSLRDEAAALVTAGETTQAEVDRVLGTDD